MTNFNDIINAEQEQLVQIFYKLRSEKTPQEQKLEKLAIKLGMRTAQIVCAVGFNPNAPQLTEVFPILGFETFDLLVQQRNDIFISDNYRRLTLENMISIYTAVKNDAEILQVMQYLLKRRLESIEERIEETVNTKIIEKYKAEIRAIYGENIAHIDFVEERLNKQHCGFRALLNEVSIIIESKTIPAGDIFFRDTILPQEKRKILKMGVIPIDLIKSRLEDDSIQREEKIILNDYLDQNSE